MLPKTKMDWNQNIFLFFKNIHKPARQVLRNIVITKHLRDPTESREKRKQTKQTAWSNTNIKTKLKILIFENEDRIPIRFRFEIQKKNRFVWSVTIYDLTRVICDSIELSTVEPFRKPNGDEKVNRRFFCESLKKKQQRSQPISQLEKVRKIAKFLHRT